jgi:homoserine O-succinyltransferase
MVDFRAKALSNRNPELLADFPADRLIRDLQNVWRRSARRLYRNWLAYMASQRARRVRLSAATETKLGMRVWSPERAR